MRTMELFDLIDLAEAVAITSRNRKESRGMQFIVKISSLLNQWMITYIIFWHCFYIFGYGFGCDIQTD